MNRKFIDTIHRNGELVVEPVLAKLPKGTIRDVRLPPSLEKRKGDFGIITASDIPGSPMLDIMGEKVPILSEKTFSYEGEPLLLLYGKEKAFLHHAAQQIVVDVESDYALDNFDQPREDQLFGEKSISRGAWQKAFDQAERIVETEYRQEDLVPDPAAPLGAVVDIEKGTYHIYVSSLWPEQVKRSVTEALALQSRQVIVHPVNPFPSDGEKLILPILVSVWAALVAWKTKSPARFSRDVPRTPLPFLRSPRSRITLRSAVGEKGAIIAQEAQAWIDMGAFPVLSDEMIKRMILGIAGSRYQVPFSIHARGVKTSAAPTRLRSGFGISQGSFAREVSRYRIARLLDADPVDTTIKLAKKRRFPTGGPVKEDRLGPLIEMVCQASDFNRKFAGCQLIRKRNPSPQRGHPYRGIGLATGYTGDGFTSKTGDRIPWSVTALLDKKDTLTLKLKAGEFPGSVRELWKARAGSILGIDPELVEIESEDPELPGIGPMVSGQRLSIAGSLVESCCNSIKRKRFKNPLPLTERKNFRPPPVEVWDREKLSGTPFTRRSWAAVVVEIEVDTVTLTPAIRGIWCAVDAGQVHSRKEAESALRSSFLKMIRHASSGDSLLQSLSSESFFKPEKENLSMPAIDISFITDSGFPASGVSQIAVTLFPAAFVSAFSQATGLYLDRLPVTPELIHTYHSREGE
jgi:CO/xanthine dehydrogenase Mo-binding subunit